MNRRRSHIEDVTRKRPEQLESEADDARANLRNTLRHLEHRLSASDMLSQVTTTLRYNGAEFAENLVTQVRNNPIPTLLAGIGVTWLITASDRPPRAFEREPSLGHRASSIIGGARDAAGRTGEAASQTADAAGRAASQVARGARGTARRAVEASRDGARRFRSRYREIREDQPLVLGTLALATGAVVGALFPQGEPMANGHVSRESDGRVRGRRPSDDAPQMRE